MCAFPKRKLNVQFQDFPKIAAFWENPEKNWSNLAKIQQILANFATFCKNQQKNSAIFNEKIEIRERCKGVHCVDLGESFPTIANSNEYLLAKIGVDTAENEP